MNPAICYGEILWDVLPTGEVPGGAPMNVAYHLNKLGHPPAVITRVGDDDRGNRLITLLEQKNLSTGLIQRDRQLPTGVVYATPNEHHEMEYDIVGPVAWDMIEWNDRFTKIFSDNTYFVYGSLVARNAASRNTLFRLLEVARHKVLDINLRPPHYDNNLLRELLERADILKLNLAELHFISGWFTDSAAGENERMKIVQQEFELDSLIVTKGGDGAMLALGGEVYSHPGFRVVVQDTVGSGDSFLAALLSGFIEGRQPQDMLEFACAVGALVTSRKGGWPDYELSDVYRLISPDKADN